MNTAELEKKGNAYIDKRTKNAGFVIIPDEMRQDLVDMYVAGALDNINEWHYPSKGEMPDKDWTKHPLNVSEECFVVTKMGIGTIARWDNDYKTWFENQPHLPVPEVVAWQYFEPPKEKE